MKREIHEVPFKGRHCSCDFGYFVLRLRFPRSPSYAPSIKRWQSVHNTPTHQEQWKSGDSEDKRAFDGQT